VLGSVPLPVLGGIVLAEVLRAGGWRETAAVVRHLTIDTWAWLVALVAFALLDLSAAMLVVLLLSAFLTFRRLGGQTGRNIVGYGPYEGRH